MKSKLLGAALLAASTLLISAPNAEAGKLRRLIYTGYSGSNITNLYTTNLSGVVTFPTEPTTADFLPSGTPGQTFPPFNAETSANYADSYGSLIEGYLTAPESGDYTFWIASDDEGALFITTDSADSMNPSKTNLICRVPVYSNYREWAKFPEQKSAAVTLEAGKSYYVQILHKEGTGGDHINLGWQLPSGKIEQPMPAWHFQPFRDTRWGEPDAEIVLGIVNPRDPATANYNIYDGNWTVVYANVNLDPPLTYQWLKNGSIVPGATQAYYRFRANTSDEGSQWSVRINGGSVTVNNSPAILYVIQDKPTVLSVTPATQNPTSVLVQFSEDVNPATAGNPANYSLSGTAGVTVQSATLGSDERTVTLKFSSLLYPTNLYTLNISGVQDMATPANTMDPASASFYIAEGGISFRVYRTASPTDLATLRSWSGPASTNPQYTNSLFDEERTITTTSYQWSLIPLQNNYQGQMIGYLTAPTNGFYKFAIASDDHSILWLGTNNLRSSKREVCNYNGSTGQWNLGAQLANQQSTNIYLEGGKQYYIEAVFRDGTGGDGVTVCWQTPYDVEQGKTMPTDNASTAANTQPFLIPARYLSTFVTFGPVTIKTNLPATLSAAASTRATFRVAVDGLRPYNFQWYRSGAAIAGATDSTYTTPYLRATDSGATFQVVVTNNFSSVTSVLAALTVTADTAKPTIASVGSVYKQAVQVRFSEPVTESTATNTANYLLFDSNNVAVAVSAATLDPADPAAVTLQTGTMPETDVMRLVVQNMADQSPAANVMNPATNTFRAHNFDAIVNINTSQAYSAVANGDRITLTAGGSDIWGAADQCVFVYKTVTGNFDYRVQGISLPPVNQWCKLGIMARASTAANSRNAFVAFTPLTPAQNTYTPQIRDATGGASTSTADTNSPLYNAWQFVTVTAQRPTVTYPSWVRLQRIGNNIYFYYSANGTNWNWWTTYYSDVSPEGPLPTTLQLGLALTSHDTARTVDGVLASFSSLNLGPLAFAQQPTNTSVVEGANATFYATPVGGTPYLYQWRTNGVPVQDATNATITFVRVPFSMNGVQVSVNVVNPYGQSITSTNALLTVIADTTAPTVRYYTNPKFNTVATECRLLFSEPMNAASAQNTANYQIFTHPGNVPLGINTAVLDTDERTVILTTTAQTPGTTYRVVVNNVIDQACCPPNAVPANSTDYFYFGGAPANFTERPDGFVIMEAEHAQVIDFTGDGDIFEKQTARAGFSGDGYMNVPNGRGGSAAAGTGTTLSRNGARMVYYINLTTTGRHIVWVRGGVQDSGNAGSDDSIFVGFNDAVGTTDATTDYLVGMNTTVDNSGLGGWSGTGFTWRSDRVTDTPSGDPLTFTNSVAGLHRFVIWHREDGTLVDKIVIEAGNRAAGNTAAPAPCTSNGGIGDIETWDWQVPPPGAPTIAIVNPTNTQTFPSGANIPLEVTYTAPSTILRVEYFAGTNLVATESVAPYSATWSSVPEGLYSLTARVTDVLGYQITSSAVQITVDSSKPIAYAVGSLNGAGIGVYFSDVSGLDATTAANPANYVVNGGAVQVIGATLEPDRLAVLLSLGTQLSGPFTVQIANVSDRGFGPNVMTPTTLDSTVVNWYLNRDVGTVNTNNPALFTDPIQPGTAQAIGMGGMYVRAGGHDIWDAADGMHFVGTQKTGDFDVAVRVAGILQADVWSKAGLMVREDLNGNSRNHLIAATPTNGQNLITMQWRPTAGAASQSVADANRPRPSPLPNAWLRVTSTNRLYTFYYGTNGTTWTALYTTNLAAVSPAYPTTVYVGLATTSHNNGTNTANLTAAYYLDIRGLAPAVISAAVVGNNIALAWPPDKTGSQLQTQANPLNVGLSTTWTTVPNSTTTNRVWLPMSSANGTVFYRLAP